MKINSNDSEYNLRLTDRNGDTYDFPDNFFVSEEAIVARTSIQDIMFAHGGVDTGDGMAQARVISITGIVAAYSAAAFETAKRALVKACNTGGLLSVIGDVVSRSISVRVSKRDPNWHRFLAAQTITIDFICEFPYWEDTAFTDSSHTLAGDDDFTVDASGSDDIMMPVITITGSVDLPSIKLTNFDDGGMYIEYNNPELYAGDVLEIDSSTGEITVNGNDARSYLAQGSAYLRLQSMVNNLRYEGGAADITVSFKKVYL